MSLISLPSLLLLESLPIATGGMTIAVKTKTAARTRRKYMMIARPDDRLGIFDPLELEEVETNQDPVDKNSSSLNTWITKTAGDR